MSLTQIRFGLIKKIVDLYIYSSIHIALGATLSIILCYSALIHIPDSNYAILVFTATMCMYCSHRVVGIEKLKDFQNEGRFAIIKKFRIHLIFYALLSGFATIYFLYGLERRIQFYLIIPAVISIFYITPLFSNKKRLRDFNHIKIYLIAIIWGLIIGLIPYLEVNQTLDVKGILYFLEKTFYIFAITIPFDIRDLTIDKHINVSTLPSKIGLKKSYQIAYGAMIITIFLVLVLFFLKLYSLKVSLALIFGYFLTILAIYISKNKTHDYYYGGLLDGTIIIVALLGIIESGILSVIF